MTPSLLLDQKHSKHLGQDMATPEPLPITSRDVTESKVAVPSSGEELSHDRSLSSDYSRDSINDEGDDRFSDDSFVAPTPPLEIYAVERRIVPQLQPSSSISLDADLLTPPAAVLLGRESSHSIVIDQRSWLEVQDEKHRYAKHLRAYHKAWRNFGAPGDFWLWLANSDYESPDCSRKQLEYDTVHYCSPEERETYAVHVTNGGLLMQGSEPVSTSEDGWIFVLRNEQIYARSKQTTAPRFHHSSFFGGECVAAAGMFVAENGRLCKVYPHSGHYRPTDEHLLFLLQLFQSKNIDLNTVEVDAQRVFKVARICTDAGRRVTKVESPHLLNSQDVVHFLLHKRHAHMSGLFRELTHWRRHLTLRVVASSVRRYRDDPKLRPAKIETENLCKVSSPVSSPSSTATYTSLGRVTLPFVPNTSPLIDLVQR